MCVWVILCALELNAERSQIVGSVCVIYVVTVWEFWEFGASHILSRTHLTRMSSEHVQQVFMSNFNNNINRKALYSNYHG